ncbi:MAG: hypothetical protein ACP5NQ_03740 [Vulcanisaeta sp.]
MSSSIQRELKALVDQSLKSLESRSLRFTRVSVREFNVGFEVDVKIYLDQPIKLSSVYELSKKIADKYNLSLNDIMIYAPHTRALRLHFIISKKR